MIRIIGLLLIAGLFNACGSASFETEGEGSVGVSSLNSETVLVVDEETAADMEDEGVLGVTDGDETDGEDNNGEDNNGEDNEVTEITTPTEMEESDDKGLKCGENGKKLQVCHLPHGDRTKKHTLCIGKPALQAMLAQFSGDSHMGDRNYAGACTEGEGSRERENDKEEGENEDDKEESEESSSEDDGEEGRDERRNRGRDGEKGDC